MLPRTSAGIIVATVHYCEVRKTITFNERSLILSWSLVFLIAGVLGFSGIAGAAAGIAKVLFFVFLVLLIVSWLMKALRGNPPA